VLCIPILSITYDFQLIKFPIVPRASFQSLRPILTTNNTAQIRMIETAKMKIRCIRLLEVRAFSKSDQDKNGRSCLRRRSASVVHSLLSRCGTTVCGKGWASVVGRNSRARALDEPVGKNTNQNAMHDMTPAAGSRRGCDGRIAVNASVPEDSR
jgi:hypothetical protein